MRILHVTGHSLVRLTPARIAAYWGRYTKHEGMAVAIDRAGGPNAYADWVNPYGLLCADKGRHRARVKELMAWADVVHCHDDSHPCQWPDWIKGKRLVYQAHIGDIPERFFAPKRSTFRYLCEVSHSCITNGYGRFFDKEDDRLKRKVWGRLGDVIDIWHPAYSPCPDARSSKLRVMLAFSNMRAKGTKINAKCPHETRKLLVGMRGATIRIIMGAPFSVCMTERQLAHVVVDDVFSPFTHLGALEGASVSSLVLTNYDEKTVRELCNFVDAPRASYPFVLATPQTIKRQIEYYASRVHEAIDVGRAARAWMEKFYDPRRILERYLEFYAAR